MSSIDPNDSEYLDETFEFLSVKQNDDNSTIEIVNSENGELQDFLKQERDELEEDLTSILKETQYEGLSEYLDPYLDSICGHFDIDEVCVEEDDMFPYLVIDLN